MVSFSCHLILINYELAPGSGGFLSWWAKDPLRRFLTTIDNLRPRLHWICIVTQPGERRVDNKRIIYILATIPWPGKRSSFAAFVKLGAQIRIQWLVSMKIPWTNKESSVARKRRSANQINLSTSSIVHVAWLFVLFSHCWRGSSKYLLKLGEPVIRRGFAS